MPCVFCGASPTTNEHAFPEWLLDVIPGGGRITHARLAPEGSDSPSQVWTTDGVLTFTANAVCGPRCNHGWMNDLENRARPFLEPMIRGHGYTLYEYGCQQVAHWALKTALTTDLLQETARRSVPDWLYPALYRARGLLPGTRVWLGGCKFGAGAFARHRTLNLDVGDLRLEGFGATLAVGHLVIEVVCVPADEGPPFDIGGAVGTALQRVWPYWRRVIWPPEFALTRDDLPTLGEHIAQAPMRFA